MKSLYFQVFILLVILANVRLIKAQGIAINSSGNSNYVGAILDLSNQNTIGSAGFLPPYVYLDSATILTRPITGDTAANLSGLLIYNTNSIITTGNKLSGPGLYYWNNTLSTPSWLFMTTGGTVLYANNGLSLSTNLDTVQLGGSNLIKTTKISLGGDTLSIRGSSDTIDFVPNGQVGIGNTKPNSSAILDLSNATHLGLLLPTMSTANLPTVKAGLIVYNTTTGCPEIDSGGVWYPVGSTRHGSVTFKSSSYWVVPNCVTSITIVASGAAGGTAETFNGGNGAVVTVKGMAVAAGEFIGIYCGQKGTCPACYFYSNYDGGGGGGGTFVWNVSSTIYPLVVAGGGGGGGHASNGASGSTTTVPTLSTGGDGNGLVASGGDGGSQGTTTVAGAGGGGGGWNTDATPVAQTGTEGAGGKDFVNSFAAGRGATSGNQPNCFGGYGGGGGGGFNTNPNHGAGGGGGGYNGGGGGDAKTNAHLYGGGGGGSGYYDSSTNTFVNPGTGNLTSSATQTNAGNGSVTISW